MFTIPLLRALAVLLTLASTTLYAQVPQILNYQGNIAVGTPPVNFNGSGVFKFALVNADGTTTFWSNDGTSTAGSEPTLGVTLSVTKGLYSVLLGDTTLTNMTAIPATVFTNTDVRLRVWFNDGTANGSQLLAPDQRVAAVGYAIVAGVANGLAAGATVPATAITGTIPSSQVAPAPQGMVLIPAGTFTMGNSVGEDTDITDAAPVSTTVSAFYMAETEVTLSQWQAVYFWAKDNGYSDLPAGSGKGQDHPVHSVSWFEVVRWCNARSAQEGLTPVYYTNNAQTAVFRTGEVNVTSVQVKWTADGYRLPTEAEWEKAARGGLSGQRFPWGNTINQNLANYKSDMSYSYDLGPIGYNALGSNGGISPATSVAQTFAANGYGLYDMVGSVWEWCWDWKGTPYAGGTDPRGALSSYGRVIRGGSWADVVGASRAAARNELFASFGGSNVGFRPVRPQFATVPFIPPVPPVPTGPTAPVVATGTATVGGSFDSFTVSGEVTNDGGTPVTRRGIVYGSTVTSTLGIATDVPAASAGTGAFSTTLTGLSPETTYFARAYATSTVGTGYGAEIAFKTAPTTPTGFSLIPAGTFTMGNSVDEDTDIADAVPVSTTVSAFRIAETEVTLSQWQAVYFWAKDNGYSDLPVGSGKGQNHPVHSVSWFEAVKWCNARSAQEGLTPVYYTDNAQTAVFKTGEVDITSVQVKWTADGYRLPTEAEWERAARGGLSGQRFPWGHTINQNLANYKSNTSYSYDFGPIGYNAIGSDGGISPATSVVGTFAANGYGLYDMAGNVWEWCWDWKGTPYAGGTDPRGALSSQGRIIRGGSWADVVVASRVAARNELFAPFGGSNVGFRPVRGL